MLDSDLRNARVEWDGLCDGVKNAADEMQEVVR